MGAAGEIRPAVGSDLAPALVARLLQDSRPVRVEVTGHSMTPLVRRGDVLTIVPSAAPPSLGDVVAFRTEGGRLVVHRIVRRRSRRLVTRGDVAAAEDAPVPAADILGVVRTVERRARRVRFGLGPGRCALAWLSRCGLLRLAARLARKLKGPSSREPKVRVRSAARALSP